MSTKQIHLRIEKLEIRSFSMTSESLQVRKGDSYTVEFSFSVSLPDQDGRFIFNLESFVDKEDRIGYRGRLAHLKTTTSFYVKSPNDFVVGAPDSNQQLDGALVRAGMEICLHQLRGIWAAKTEGTPLEFITIPLLNLESLLEKSLYDPNSHN